MLVLFGGAALTDTKELVAQVRAGIPKNAYLPFTVHRVALAALSELEERLEAAEREVSEEYILRSTHLAISGREHDRAEAAERERDEMAMVLDGLGWKRIRPGQWERQEMK